MVASFVFRHVRIFGGCWLPAYDTVHVRGGVIADRRAGIASCWRELLATGVVLIRATLYRRG